LLTFLSRLANNLGNFIYICRVKLSIIIPVYRVEATLDRCVESVVSQDFDDFELLLVDDGSPDGCPQMCDRWAASDHRISVIHKPNGGLSDARNAGLERATGEFVTFIDSDDYIGPGTLTAVISRMGNNDLVEYPIWQHYGNRRRQHLLSLENRQWDNVTDYWLGCQAYLHTYAANKVYRRWLFSDVRFPKGRVFEDAWTLPLLLKKRPKVATVSEGCYYYCDNPNGITAKANGTELAQLLEAHLTAQMPMDDLYYLHLLNLQMDVCRLTDCYPQLQARRVRPVGNIKMKLKAIMVNFIGIKGICTLNKATYKFSHW